MRAIRLPEPEDAALPGRVSWRYDKDAAMSDSLDSPPNISSRAHGRASTYQTFATRRLFRQLSVLGPAVADLRISTGGASWLVRVYRPEQFGRLASEASR